MTIELRSTQSAIGSAAAQAAAWLESYNPSPKTMYLVPLAIEEIVTNCIHYGYDDPGEHTIVITLSVAESTLKMAVEDDGHPFDPLAQQAPDLSLPVEDRQIGGLGIHLLRKLSDAMTYERRDGRNRLTLIKRLS